MKRFTRAISVAVMAICLSVCCLFTGCALKYAGTYKFESMTYTVLGLEKTETVGENYQEDYMVLKISLGDKFTLTESTDGQKTIKEGTWEEIEEGKIKLVYTADSREQTIEIVDGKAVISYTVSILGSEIGAKITLAK